MIFYLKWRVMVDLWRLKFLNNVKHDKLWRNNMHWRLPIQIPINSSPVHPWFTPVMLLVYI